MTDVNSTDHSCRAAVLTPNAPGAIAVIRVVGRGIVGRVGELLRRFSVDTPVELSVGRPVPVRIFDGAALLDEAVALLRRDGRGESLEIATHGGVRVVQVVLGLLTRRGVTVVPAEELAEAWGADPIERDVDRALLKSESRRLTQWLLVQRMILPGYLAGASALSAAQREEYNRRTTVAIRLVAGLRVALVGPPNAGKSTLANRLIGHDRVIVSERAGTTRDWVAETAMIDGWPVTLTDTAGVRETDDPIEIEAIRRGRAQAHAADLAVIVLDGSAATERVRMELDALIGILPPDQPRVVVLNKSDLMTEAAKSFLGSNASVLVVSANTCEDVGRLECGILAGLGLDCMDEIRPTGFLSKHVI